MIASTTTLNDMVAGGSHMLKGNQTIRGQTNHQTWSLTASAHGGKEGQMNNYQWLLQMDGADRKAWFDSGHVETEERALDGDAETDSSNTDAVSERYATAFKWLDRLGYGKGGVIDNSLCDTPEQGEVVMPLENWREYLGAESENEDSRDKIEADVRDTVPEWHVDKVVGWLDRQAAITEHEVLCHPDERNEQIAELQAQINELTASCDEKWNKYVYEHKRADKLTAERERYRELFGKCLDYADAIHALMDEIDEGWS